MDEKICKLIGHKMVQTGYVTWICSRCAANSYDDINMFFYDWYYWPRRWIIQTKQRVGYWLDNRRNRKPINEDEIPF